MFEFLTQMMAGGQSAALPTAGGQGGFAGLGMGNPGSYGGQFATNAPVPQTPSAPGGGGVAGLLADPNVQSMLAGIGTGLDPDGVGAAIGKPTQAMIQNKQMGKAMEKQDARWKAVIDAIGTGSVGKATIKEDGKGGTTLTLGAPEGGLGTLNQPLQQQPQQDGFEQTFFNTFSGMLKKLGINIGGGM